MTEKEWKKCLTEDKQLAFDHPELTAKIKPPKKLCVLPSLSGWIFLFKARNLLLKFGIVVFALAHIILR